MSALNLATIARVVREEILARCEPESCIETTRALIETLRYFGISARPIPVRVTIFNADAAHCIRTKVPSGEWPSPAFAMRIKGGDQEPAPGRWNGHLVAVAGKRLIDPSIDQFSRPAHGIAPAVGSGVFGLPADWAGEDLVHEDPGGLMVVYKLIADHTYRSAPAWRERRDMQRAVVASAIRRLRSLSLARD